MAGDEIEEYRYRRGYWLRLVRRRAGMNLDAVAKLMDYSTGSGSTIKLWEDGKRDPSDVQIQKLARVYGVPAEIFTDPDMTDEERLEDRVKRILTERARRQRGQTA